MPLEQKFGPDASVATIIGVPVVTLLLVSLVYVAMASKGYGLPPRWHRAAKVLAPFVVAQVACPPIVLLRSALLKHLYFNGAVSSEHNTVTAGFLQPAGIVWALVASFLFQRTHERLSTVTMTLNEHTALSTSLGLFIEQSEEEETPTHSSLKASLSREATRMKTMRSSKISLGQSGSADVLRSKNVQSQVQHKAAEVLMEQSKLLAKKEALEKDSLSFAAWLLLESLSVAMFLSVLVMETGSPRANIFFCLLAAQSIALINLVLSDMNEIAFGLFEVQMAATDSMNDAPVNPTHEEGNNRKRPQEHQVAPGDAFPLEPASGVFHNDLDPSPLGLAQQGKNVLAYEGQSAPSAEDTLQEME